MENLGQLEIVYLDFTNSFLGGQRSILVSSFKGFLRFRWNRRGCLYTMFSISLLCTKNETIKAKLRLHGLLPLTKVPLSQNAEQ